MKLMLNPQNSLSLCQKAIQILLDSPSKPDEDAGVKNKGEEDSLKVCILNKFFTMCIKERLALPIILNGFWSESENKIVLEKSEGREGEENMSILELLLKLSLHDIIENQLKYCKLCKMAKEQKN